MHTKLKLEIELYTDEVSGTSGSKFDGYFLKLTVRDKDDRFEASNENDMGYLRFGGSGFSIKSNINKKFGALNDNSFVIPHLDRMGFPYLKYFTTDKERYDYLKVLHSTILDWANYWWGFSEDSVSKYIINGKSWEVVCETIDEYILDKVY